MAIEHSQPSSEATVLRRRIEDLEREQHERTAQANAALAAAQDRAYWLDRWNIDLNSLMSRRGAGELRAGLRAARKVYRLLYRSRYRAVDHARALSLKVTSARRALEEERHQGEDAEEADVSRGLSPDPLREAPVTERLHGRLSPEDVAAVEACLSPAEAALWETADEADRKRLALAFAAHHGVQPALGRSGLSDAMPSDAVPAANRGPTAGGGSTYGADLVAASLAEGGLEITAGMRGLDFGCTSGRVVRVLATAYPDVQWHGCDPVPDAIEWARANLPGIAFERSPEHPPLPYEDESFDFAFAISVWSHFAETAALDWLKEMRRVVRPGGRLVVTTHGEQTIAHTRREGVQLEEIRAALAEHGFWYAPEFGEAGDHGVANPDWGTAFLTPEWVLAKLTPQWSVALFRPGRVEDNQDLYVLERR